MRNLLPSPVAGTFRPGLSTMRFSFAARHRVLSCWNRESLVSVGFWLLLSWVAVWWRFGGGLVFLCFCDERLPVEEEERKKAAEREGCIRGLCFALRERLPGCKRHIRSTKTRCRKSSTGNTDFSFILRAIPWRSWRCCSWLEECQTPVYRLVEDIFTWYSTVYIRCRRDPRVS